MEKSLAGRIALARKQAALTQAFIEEKLELTAGALSKIESGHREITSFELARFAKVVGKNVGWFFEESPVSGSVHFRGGVVDSESYSDLAWFREFVTSYKGLQHRVKPE